MSKRILLVSGHVSGYNACAETGVNEGDLNIELVNILEALLSDYAQVEVYPRGRDWYKDNKAGVSQVNPKDYDYIFEVHFNAGKGTGTSVYLHTNYNKGVTVEKKILAGMKALGVRLRGSEGFNRKNTLLNCNVCQKAGVDYALMEVLFYDNAADMDFYKARKQEVANAIAAGIIDGFGLRGNAEEPDVEEPENAAYRYRVQVGSFKSSEKAVELAKELSALHYDTMIVKAMVQ